MTGDGAGDWELEPGGDEEEEDEACSSSSSSSMNETRQRERMQLSGAQQDGGASVCVIRRHSPGHMPFEQQRIVLYKRPTFLFNFALFSFLYHTSAVMVPTSFIQKVLQIFSALFF